MPDDLITPAAAASRDLKRNVSSGLYWSGLGRVLQQAVQFGVSVVLARLLSPGDYGLMAMAAVFTGFAGMLADGGFNVALVQRQELTETQIHTVFWLNLTASALLAIITFIGAPWLALFYHAPTLTLIFRVIALNFVFGAMGGVPAALLQKRMQFKLITRNDTVALFISGVVGISLAVWGAGVWSLVAQSLTGSCLSSVFRCWTCRWWPRLLFSLSALKELFRFSSHLYGFNFINYWSRNADNLVVGKYFGAPALGVYARAYALMLLPISQITGVISQVIFPAFSSIQDDKERVKRIYLRAIGIIALLAFPMMIGLLAVAEPFILTVYGAKWIEVSVLLQILSVVGMMQVLGNSTGWLFLSQGRTKLMFKWGAAYSIVAILSFVVGTMIGSVRAVAICYAIVNAIFVYPELDSATRIVGMKATEVVSAVKGPLLSSLIMGAVVTLAGFVMPSDWLAWQSLFALSLIGAVVYAAIIIAFKLTAWCDLVIMIRERRGPAGVNATDIVGSI